MTDTAERNVPIAFIVRQMILIALGALVSAVSVNLFFVPHRFVSGGINGLALFSHYLSSHTPIALSVGVWILLYNIPLFLAGFKSLGKGFLLGSCYGTVLQAAFVVATDWLAKLNLVHDPLLAAIFGGTLGGIGTGITLRVNGSLGGTDIIGALMRKRSSISIGTVTLIFNVFVIALAGAVLSIESASYALVSIFTGAIALDKTIQGINTSKAIFIITAEHKAIANKIMIKLNRGVTFLDGEGAFSGTEMKILYCVVSLHQLARVKYYVQTIDPHAFMSVADVAEVVGQGFKPSPF